MEDLFLAWGISAGVLVLVGGILGRLAGRGYLGILIDSRGRYSLTQLQMVLWTVVILSLIFAVYFARQVSGDAPGGGLGFDIPDELLILMGISLGSGGASVGIKAGKDAHPETISAPTIPRFRQIFLVEEGEAAEKAVDIGKFQNFWITLILVTAYLFLAISELREASSPAQVDTLPIFDGSFVTLLGISHAGYLAGKLPDRPGTPSGRTLDAVMAD
jgi:hypothetical protein